MVRTPRCGVRSAQRADPTFFRDANTGAGQDITGLAAAVQLRLRVAIVRKHFHTSEREVARAASFEEIQLVEETNRRCDALSPYNNTKDFRRLVRLRFTSARQGVPLTPLFSISS